MSFFDRLHTIQQAPVRTRKIILVVTVAIIMSGVISIWATLLRRQNSNTEDKENKSVFEPFSIVFGSAKNTFNESIKSLYE